MRRAVPLVVLLLVTSSNARAEDKPRSLLVKRGVYVLDEPKTNAHRIGRVTKGTRLAWHRVVEGSTKKCARWYEVQPRGWVCGDDVVPSVEAPAGREVPKLKAGKALPSSKMRLVARRPAKVYATKEDVEAGKVARVLLSAINVPRVQKVRIGEREYYRTKYGGFVEAEHIVVRDASEMEGVRLDEAGAPTLPLGWLQSRGSLRGRVPIYAEPRKGAAVVRRAEARSVVPVLEVSPGAKYLRVGEGEWARAGDVHVARATTPPKEAGPDERWLDVDVEEQVLVAYQGKKPVYATLVSTGKERMSTRRGVFRIEKKFAMHTMASPEWRRRRYSVEQVPWAMYFYPRYALHGTYWHDSFGRKMSHGCVNLAPRDARFLFLWTEPNMPLGWSHIFVDEKNPGTLIRIRDRREPDPEFKSFEDGIKEMEEVDKHFREKLDDGSEA